MSALGTALMAVLINKNSKATIFPSFIGNDMYFHINFYLCNYYVIVHEKTFYSNLKSYYIQYPVTTLLRLLKIRHKNKI